MVFPSFYCSIIKFHFLRSIYILAEENVTRNFSYSKTPSIKEKIVPVLADHLSVNIPGNQSLGVSRANTSASDKHHPCKDHLKPKS